MWWKKLVGWEGHPISASEFTHQIFVCGSDAHPWLLRLCKQKNITLLSISIKAFWVFPSLDVFIHPDPSKVTHKSSDIHRKRIKNLQISIQNHQTFLKSPPQTITKNPSKNDQTKIHPKDHHKNRKSKSEKKNFCPFEELLDKELELRQAPTGLRCCTRWGTPPTIVKKMGLLGEDL